MKYPRLWCNEEMKTSLQEIFKATGIRLEFELYENLLNVTAYRVTRLGIEVDIFYRVGNLQMYLNGFEDMAHIYQRKVEGEN